MRSRMQRRPMGPGINDLLAPEAGSERSEADDSGAWRGRPGRRSGEERTAAVMELLSGKASVDQLACRFGVRPEIVERWREVAVEAMAEALKLGGPRSTREGELEKKLSSLERAFADLAIRHELVQRAIDERPTRPGK